MRARQSGVGRSFFSEIIASINDVRFSPCGRYLLSRDYMTLKLWDINQEAAPLAVYPVHESLRGKVCVAGAAGWWGVVCVWGGVGGDGKWCGGGWGQGVKE